jgi:hypothetical protein
VHSKGSAKMKFISMNAYTNKIARSQIKDNNILQALRKTRTSQTQN